MGSLTLATPAASADQRAGSASHCGLPAWWLWSQSGTCTTNSTMTGSRCRSLGCYGSKSNMSRCWNAAPASAPKRSTLPLALLPAVPPPLLAALPAAP